MRKKASSQKGIRAKNIFLIFCTNIFPMLLALTCVVPIIWIFYSSLKTLPEFTSNPIALPKVPDFSAYRRIFTESDLLRNILNSAWNTVISVIFVLVIGFINGYFLARFKFKLRNFLYGFYLSELLIPAHTLLLPLYIIFNQVKLTNTSFALLPIYICAGITTTTYLMQGYIKGLSRSMEEAAAIDGASFFRTLTTIVFPLTKPILATVGIIHLFYCWNEFSFALVMLTDKKYFTISLAMMAFKSKNRIDYPSMMAVTFVAMLPALIAYFISSKQIIKGMVEGAVKG